MKFKEALAFDDVLLEPSYSQVLPHEVDLKTKFTKSIQLDIPLCSAAMDTVTEHRLANVMVANGGIGVIHKNFEIDEQAAEASLVNGMVAAAVGVGDEALRRAEFLVGSGVDALVIDTAHGHSAGVIQTVKRMKTEFPEAQLVAGNVATYDGALVLADAGADAIKVGIGPGSACTTRVVCGVGVPQLTAIIEASRACRKTGVSLIADGGITHSGDIAKAIAAGADCVMIGSLFAGTDESAGETFQHEGRLYKAYRGMGSVAAMSKGSADRYSQNSAVESDLVPQGIEGAVLHTGSAADLIHQLMGGLRSAMGYTGNSNISEMKIHCEFQTVSRAGLLEGHVHDIDIVKKAPNYSKWG